MKKDGEEVNVIGKYSYILRFDMIKVHTPTGALLFILVFLFKNSILRLTYEFESMSTDIEL